MALYNVEMQDTYTGGQCETQLELDPANLGESLREWLQNEHDMVDSGFDAEFAVDQVGERDGHALVVIVDKLAVDEGCFTILCTKVN